ncbi:choline ABC transporter ATP-binding protein [Benzoatithermus flavus]|uniref:Choline ABC transporter ATP-binding protein n=1 Tax=Benzoatithermus flavus TaxID=3108223 RepID=A0ABU8XWQ6_9PROT
MPAVAFQNVDIVFGDKPELALPLIDRGLSREQILAETGQVLGVAGCTLAVERGQICVLMGLSGSGKSTLLRAVNRLNKVVRGSVLVEDDGRAVDMARCDGRTLRRLRSQRIAMVFQQFALLPWRTVAENVAFGLELRGVPRAERERIVQEKLALVHLERWAGKHAHELSGGMQQRVGLARAFATDADILLMDEPFSALDPLIRDRLQDELLELQAKLHKTIVFVSHDLDEALKLGNTVAIMEGGRIVQAGPPEVIVTQPATEYVRSFVANVNPLNVLRLGTLMRPVTSLGRDGDGMVRIDPRIHLTARLDGSGALASVDGAGLPLRPLPEIEPFTDGTKPTDWLLVASPEAPMRLAIDAVRMSGWPVLVVDEMHRVLGVVGIDELLEGLRRRSA